MKNKVIVLIFLAFVIVFGLLIPKVNINYDLQKYLPDNSLASKSLEEFSSKFGDTSNLILVFDENSLSEAKNIKSLISNFENIEKVIFVDDYLNQTTYSIIREQANDTQKAQLDSLLNLYLNQGYTYESSLYQLSFFFPNEFSDAAEQIQMNYESYVSENEVLFEVVFSEKAYTEASESSLDDIKLLLEDENYNYYLSGEVASIVFTENTISRETKIITLMIIPIILLLLILLSKSYFDIILFVMVAGSAIVINLGSNIFLPDISFITQSMAIALQLAISLDYIIFMLNAYHNEKTLGLSDLDALNNAKSKSYKPIIASALTTGVSFLALIFMRFTIGFDIGIVFFKAIIISLIYYFLKRHLLEY
ncbi:MAG: MMPL family transporter, partial [Bacillota bacterium]